MEDYGWLDYVSDGDISGTTGESRRLEEHVVPNLLYSSANNVYGSCSSYGTEWNKILLTK